MLVHLDLRFPKNVLNDVRCQSALHSAAHKLKNSRKRLCKYCSALRSLTVRLPRNKHAHVLFPMRCGDSADGRAAHHYKPIRNRARIDTLQLHLAQQNYSAHALSAHTNNDALRFTQCDPPTYPTRCKLPPTCV